jgi:hypothetical protein
MKNLSDHPFVVIIGVLASLATIFGFLFTTLRSSNKKDTVLPDRKTIEETQKEKHKLLNLQIDWPWEIYATPEPTKIITPIAPESTFDPSSQILDFSVDCILELRETEECTDPRGWYSNPIAITVQSVKDDDNSISISVSSPGWSVMDFSNIDIGNSVYYHNDIYWFEIRYEKRDQSWSGEFYFRVFAYLSKSF